LSWHSKGKHDWYGQSVFARKPSTSEDKRLFRRVSTAARAAGES
jgi:hypothetical protein